MTHKSFNQSLPAEYKPLHVGAALGSDLGYLRDDTGENISHKNRNYCELTGLYWIWKNSKSDIVGLCHYRRYLSKWPMDKKLKHILTQADIERRLRKADIILPVPVIGKKNTGELYRSKHSEKDYDLTRAAIQTVSPEYLAAFDRFMQGRACCQCNMFIASKEIADAYCDWLFSIYDELEKHVDLTGYSAYQARIYGFMSERLLNVWVEHNQLKKSYAFFASTEIDYVEALKTKLLEFVKK